MFEPIPVTLMIKSALILVFSCATKTILTRLFKVKLYKVSQSNFGRAL